MPLTDDDAFDPSGVYVAAPLSALLIVTVSLLALPPAVELAATYFVTVEGVTVVVYVFGTSTVPLAVSLYANAPKTDRSPNPGRSPFTQNTSALNLPEAEEDDTFLTSYEIVPLPTFCADNLKRDGTNADVSGEFQPTMPTG